MYANQKVVGCFPPLAGPLPPLRTVETIGCNEEHQELGTLCLVLWCWCCIVRHGRSEQTTLDPTVRCLRFFSWFDVKGMAEGLDISPAKAGAENEGYHPEGDEEGGRAEGGPSSSSGSGSSGSGE